MNPRRFYPLPLLTIFILLIAMLTIPIVTAQEVPPSDATLSVKWSPDNLLLATAQKDGSITIRDQAGNILQTIQADPKESYTVSWSPDGKWLASGGADPTVKIWDVETGTLVQSVEGFAEGVFELAWQPNGNILLTSGFDTFRAWNTDTWQPITKGLSVTLSDIKWIPDGSRFAYSAGKIGTGTIQNGEVQVSSFDLQQSKGYPYSIDWNSTGDQMVSAGGLDGTVRLWDADTGKEINLLLQTDQLVQYAVFANDTDTQVVAVSDIGTLYQIDIPSGTVQERMYLGANLWSLAWNPVTDTLAIGGWLRADADLTDGNITRSLPGTGVFEMLTLNKSSSS